MRATKLFGLIIVGLGLVVVIPPITTGQPGGGFGGRKSGGGGFSMQDPNTLFDYLAKGRQFFLISETRSLNGPLTQFAQEKRISNGQITRQQFLEFNEWKTKQQAAAGSPGGNAPSGGGFQMKGFPFGGKKGSDSPQPNVTITPGVPPSPDAIQQLADAEFKRRDDNKDGRLTPDEMNGSLRSNLARWDTNGDRLLDFNEFKEYFASRIQGNDDPGRGAAAIIIEDEDLDRKPVVFRVGGKMPTGMPAWFKELDTDTDGQVALYEWRRASKSLDDFTSWDLNADGFITPEEALRQQTALSKTTATKSPGSMAFGGNGGEGNGKEGGKGRFGFGRPGGNGDGSSERPKFGGFPGGGFPGGGFPKGSDKAFKKGRN